MNTGEATIGWDGVLTGAVPLAVGTMTGLITPARPSFQMQSAGR
jgi:hypothetical protein